MKVKLNKKVKCINEHPKLKVGNNYYIKDYYECRIVLIG